ncbi:MAG: sigma-70 family RNA polymerase sigma factor [Gemmatimonadota bacterium]
MSEASGEITRLLHDLADGEEDAFDRLVPIVYDRLRRIARRQMAREDTGHTLTATALVHEAYADLVDLERIDWQDRAHFFAIASRLMRRILIDHAVARKAQKRGGDRARVPLDEAFLVAEERPDDLLALDEALTSLERLDERQCRVVECRFFAGMTIEATAEALGVSAATVSRDWTSARAWLNRKLSA